jgi:hypothetical protein
VDEEKEVLREKLTEIYKKQDVKEQGPRQKSNCSQL